MSWFTATLAGLGVAALIWALCVLALIRAGRRADARALARFVPDCVVLFRRLARDRRIPARRRLVLGLLVLYLVSPIDLVPDFIPVAGQLDDAIVAALALRLVLRSGGPELLREHWPGPVESLVVLERLAFGNA